MADSKKIIINPNRNQIGRSVYICKKKKCIDIAIKGKKITKMLKVQQDLMNEDLINILKGGELLKTA